MAGFSRDLKSGEWARSLQQAEVLLGDANALLTCLKASAAPALKWAQSTWAGEVVMTIMVMMILCVCVCVCTCVFVCVCVCM